MTKSFKSFVSFFMFNVDLVAKDQFKTDKSKNRVGANKSLFTIAMKFKYMQ